MDDVLVIVRWIHVFGSVSFEFLTIEYTNVKSLAEF